MKRIIFPFFASLLLVTACSSDDGLTGEVQPPAVTEEQPVEGMTRVNIVSKVANAPSSVAMQAGLYMVNYQDGQPTDLLAADNYVNNQLLNYTDGVWTTENTIYWSDTTVPADFYAYAPFVQDVTDSRQLDFRVQTDQTTAEAVAKSDFLWGSVIGKQPTAESFNLTLNHQLSSLTVAVTGGAGFSEGELLSSDVSVTIGGSRTQGTVDLKTGVVTATGEVADVTCANNGDLTYTAILLPQQIPFANLIQINWKGSKYTLQRSFTLEAKRHYVLSVQLKKTQSGLDVGISGWDILDEDFGGVVGG